MICINDSNQFYLSAFAHSWQYLPEITIIFKRQNTNINIYNFMYCRERFNLGKKDLCAKDYFGKAEVFADVVNGVFFDGKNIVNKNDLEPASGEFLCIDNNESQQIYVDVCRRWKRNNTVIAICAIENQSYVDYGMIIRTLKSEVLMYNTQLKEIEDQYSYVKENGTCRSSNEFLSGIPKGTLLTPVITLVINLSDDKWDAKNNLHDMLNLSDEIVPYVNNYHLNTFDYHDYENYEQFNTELKIFFEALASSKDKVRLRSVFEKEKTVRTDTANMIATYLNIKNINKYMVKENDNEEGKVNMCKAIDDLINDGRVEGREEGRAEGLIEGRELLLFAQVKDGEITIESASKRLNITPEEFKFKYEQSLV